MLEHLRLYWEFFADSFLTGCFAAWLLAQAGVLVVARDQIFLGAAISQASTLGIAAALWLGALVGAESWLQSPVFSTAMAVTFSVLAAFATTRVGSRDSREAVTGWVFLVAGSLALLIVVDSPHGQEEVQNALFSSIVVARRFDAWLFGALAIVSTLWLFVYRRSFQVLVLDPAMAAAVGMRVSLWSFLSAAWLGISIGLSIGASGLLFTFGCLVLPALVARNVLREAAPMFLVAPLIAVVTTALSFLLADRLDYPPGQLTVVSLGLFVVLAWIYRWVRRGVLN